MKDAEKHMGTIIRRLRTCGCVLMLDFDGTLAPIVANHNVACMSSHTRKLIQCVARRFPVAVISGRALSDVRKRVSLPVSYAGSHGLETHIAGVRAQTSAKIPRTAMSTFLRAVRALERVGRLYAGIRIEDKRLSYAAHYRALSPAEARLFVEGALMAVGPYIHPGGIRVLNDMCTFDVMPDLACTKGDAVRMFGRALRKNSSCLPIYIGDGSTDEDAFRALPDGVTIRVGKSATSAAEYYFNTRGGVDKFLHKIL